MIFVLGGRGRLGQAIATEYSAENPMLIDKAVYRDWWRQGSPDLVARYFEKAACGSLIFVAAGLLDPRLSSEDLMNVNFKLPRNIIEGAKKNALKVITFGTVMEGLLSTHNSYLQSKVALGRYVADVAASDGCTTHLQIHTLYGAGHPSDFMFLGQMLNSIRHGTIFKMTRGAQLREYHHVDDETVAIRKMIESNIAGVVDVSHGQPVSLRQIAESVFSSFGTEQLLRIGALSEPLEENYESVFKRPPALTNVYFRETLPAIVDYLKSVDSKLSLGSTRLRND